MFCNKCGNENVVGSMFCNKCGNKLIDVPDECKDINLNVNNSHNNIFKETLQKNVANMLSKAIGIIISILIVFILFALFRYN